MSRASPTLEGNLTGISLFTLALVGKRLELVKELLPSAKRVALVVNPQHPGEWLELAAAKDAASRLGLTVRYFPVSSEGELDAARPAVCELIACRTSGREG